MLLLSEVPTLNTILQSDDVDFQVNKFTSVFQSCIDLCAPMVTKQITRPPAPWMTNELEESIHKRNQLQKALKCDRDNTLLESQYKEAKKKVRHDIKK